MLISLAFQRFNFIFKTLNFILHLSHLSRFLDLFIAQRPWKWISHFYIVIPDVGPPADNPSSFQNDFELIDLSLSLSVLLFITDTTGLSFGGRYALLVELHSLLHIVLIWLMHVSVVIIIHLQLLNIWWLSNWLSRLDGLFGLWQLLLLIVSYLRWRFGFWCLHGDHVWNQRDNWGANRRANLGQHGGTLLQLRRLLRILHIFLLFFLDWHQLLWRRIWVVLVRYSFYIFKLLVLFLLVSKSGLLSLFIMKIEVWILHLLVADFWNSLEVKIVYSSFRRLIQIVAKLEIIVHLSTAFRLCTEVKIMHNWLLLLVRWRLWSLFFKLPFLFIRLLNRLNFVCWFYCLLVVLIIAKIEVCCLIWLKHLMI